MDTDAILGSLKEFEVEYILIGGMNFLLRHEPELTFDVDVWIEDDAKNRARLNGALRKLGAEWGATEKEWRSVPEDPQWLSRQKVYCLTTPCGALDIFRSVQGLEGRYPECRKAALQLATASGVPYVSLSDQHMLECQLALPGAERKERRISILKKALTTAAQQN